MLKRAERREQGKRLGRQISEVGTTFIFLLFIWAQTLQDGRTYVFWFSIWTFLYGKMTSQDWQPYLEILSFNIRPPWKVYRFVVRAAHVNALGDRRSRSDLALVINLFLYRIGFGERSCLATNSPRRIDAIQYDFKAHRLEKGLRSMLCTVVFYSWLRVVCSASAKQWLPSVNNEQLKATKASITRLDSPTGWKSSPEKIFQQRRRRQQQTAEQREHRLAKRRQPRQQDTEERQRQKTNKQLPRCKRNRWRELGGTHRLLCVKFLFGEANIAKNFLWLKIPIKPTVPFMHDSRAQKIDFSHFTA